MFFTMGILKLEFLAEIASWAGAGCIVEFTRRLDDLVISRNSIPGPGKGHGGGIMILAIWPEGAMRRTFWTDATWIRPGWDRPG